MNPEAPPSVSLTQGLADRAVTLAAACYDLDPATVFEPGRRDGRGKVRLLAAIALTDPVDRPAAACARVMGVNVTMMAPTQMERRGVSSAQVRQVRSQLFAEPLPDGPVLALAEDAKRGEAGWKHPARDADFDGRVVKARKAGKGPTDIAREEGCSRNRVLWALRQSGLTFAPAQRGRPPKDPSQRAQRKPRPKVPPRSTSGVTRPAAQTTTEQPGPSPTPVLVTPFPENHPVWSPLPNSTPIRLIDHRRGCRWPVTVEAARGPFVCNLSTTAHGLYCERHRWLSIAPSARWGERRLAGASA